MVYSRVNIRIFIGYFSKNSLGLTTFNKIKYTITFKGSKYGELV